MNIIPISKIISEHRKEKGWLQQDLCNELNRRGINIKVKAISAWESGISQPPLLTFFVLCEIFNITEIYETVFGHKPDDKMSLLNDEGKNRANEYIDYLISTKKYEKAPIMKPSTANKPPHRFIRLYDTYVSAGHGNFLDNDSYDEIERTDNIPQCADFGVKISGDSMEPLLHDKQIVWVKQQNAIENDEIGIFLLDGQTYCKKLLKKDNALFLVSLNSKYKPIAINTGSFSVLGKLATI